MSDIEGKIARVVAQYKNYYDVEIDNKVVLSQVTGRYSYNASASDEYPVVGDLVVLREIKENFALIESILPRKTLFCRKDMWSKSGRQMLASNFDVVFICTSLNNDFNIKRLNRYHILAQNSGAEIVILLTKCDLCPNYLDYITKCRQMFNDVNVMAISTITGIGIKELRKQFCGNKIGLLLGSSGVGKSSIVNKLCGESIASIGEIREDDGKGKHTTVARHLFNFMGGAIIDSPGLREVGIVGSEDSIKDFYEDIEYWAKRCKFSDCSHTNEKGCRIQEAIFKGELSLEKYIDYKRIRKENELLNDRAGFLYKKWQKSKAKSRELRRMRQK